MRTRTVVEGIGFTEGPLWTMSGTLLVTSMSRGQIYRVAPETGEAVVVARPGGRPTGLAQDDQATIWIVHAADARGDVPAGIQRWRSGCGAALVASACDAPNDCALGPDGRLWFTDPLGSSFEPQGPVGRLRALDRRTGVVTTVARELRYPNGLAFSADGRVLFVAETALARVLRFEVSAGEVGGGEVFFALRRGHPDGMALDAEGNIYVAAPTAGCVEVVDPNGSHRGTIEIGDGTLPTNVCFGGPEHQTLFITVAKGGKVVAVDVEVPGRVLGGWPRVRPHVAEGSVAHA
jgi:gluconolactonase